MSQLANNALVTVEEQREYLELKTAEHDNLLEILINSVSDLFDRFTDRKLKEAEYTNLPLDGNGEKTLDLPNYPISQISAITEDDVALTEDTDFYLYSGDNEGYIYKISGNWLKKRKTIKITYTAGFSTVPTNLKLACMKQVAFEFQQRKTSSWGETARTFPDGSVTLIDQSLLPLVKKVLKGYQKL